MQLDVLYEDNHLLAVNKPAGTPTMGARPETPTLLDYSREYVRTKHGKPGNVYLGVVSRLDAPVTGVVLMARTSKAASRLSAAFRDRQVGKWYLAAVEGDPGPTSGTLVNYLRKDERHRKVHCTTAEAAGAQRAELAYSVIGAGKAGAVMIVRLVTGRKHQIRVQLAKLGCPIVGDRKYGAATSLPTGIGLHALRLEVEHPVRREPLALHAPTPPAWDRLSRLTDEEIEHACQNCD